jgi:hypothetical protein
MDSTFRDSGLNGKVIAIRHMDGRRSVNNRELRAYYTTINRRESSIEIGACCCGCAALEMSAGIKANYRRTSWARAT